jgi:L-ascorbate metabolism protein UlaG (beta-lactamase superfamily)
MRKFVFLLAILFAWQAGATEPRKEIAITWWGNMSVELNLGDVNLVFDPYIKPDEPRFQYIFVSHDHYDHCHEPTLRALTAAGNPLALLFAPRGAFYASQLDGPNNWTDTPLADLAFVPRDKTVAMYAKYLDTVNGNAFGGNPFGPVEVVTGKIRVEAFRSHEDPPPKNPGQLSGAFPNLGYIVTDLASGRTFAHTGDLWNAYPEMERMRGKIDVLFYPLAKLNAEERRKMMDYIRPKIAIPTHYRIIEPDFPIPATYLKELKGVSDADLYKDQALLRKACLGHWYPSPADPPAAIAADREALKDLTRVVEVKAGTRYVLPDDLAQFQGRVRPEKNTEQGR